MQDIVQQLGELLANAIPTALLFIVLVVAYEFLIQGPLTAVLARRRALTEGAMEDARKAIAAAEAKAQEYAERLRQARAERLQTARAAREAMERRARFCSGCRAAGSRPEGARGQGRTGGGGRSRPSSPPSLRRRSRRPGRPRRFARRCRGFPLNSFCIEMEFFVRAFSGLLLLLAVAALVFAPAARRRSRVRRVLQPPRRARR